MTTVTIPVSDDRFERLRALAQQAGISPEEFLKRRVEFLLDQPDEEFKTITERILEKNRELYRRLA
jgi:hypothetical protein